MALGGLWSRLTSGIFGVGIGVAASDAIQPALEPVKQDAWAANQYKVLPLGELAELVAQALVTMASAAEEAGRSGYNENRLEAAVQSALTVPGTGELLRMLRRETIDEDQAVHGFRKAKREPQFDSALLDLMHEKLDPAELAKAIHRNIIPEPDLLIAAPPLTPGKVPQVPQSKIDPIAEVAAYGYDAERLRVLVGNSGLPLSLFEMLELLNRGDVDESDVKRSIAQSNLRNEYMDVALNLRRRLLTPHEYAELALRGWIDKAERDDGAALSGMEPADTELLENMLGRPLAIRQLVQAIARGGKYGGDYEGVPEPYLTALRQSNVRPEWGNLAYANRYTLPSAFVLRSMAQAGELTEKETEQLLLDSGWAPELAAKVAGKWAGSTTAKGKELTRTELAAEYAGGYISEAEYRASLTDLGYTGHAQDLEVHLGDAARLKKYREKVADAIGAVYMAGKYDAATASARLASVGIAGDAATMLLAVWDILKEASAGK